MTSTRKARWCEAVNRLQRDIERGIYANGDVAACQVIVNGGGHAHDREAHLPEGQGTGLRSIAADNDQGVNILLVQGAHRLEAALLGLELLGARAAQDGTALLDNAPHRAGI